jgi:hypothetical protein
MSFRPDPKPAKRVRDKKLTRLLHTRGVICVLCGKPGSLHHIAKHPRHDVPENLAGLCGDGVSGHHGLIESGDLDTRRLFGEYLAEQRPDTIFWVQETMGEEEGNEWLRLRYFVEI